MPEGVVPQIAGGGRWQERGEVAREGGGGSVWQLHTCRQRSQDVGNDNERGGKPFGQSAVLEGVAGGARWQGVARKRGKSLEMGRVGQMTRA